MHQSRGHGGAGRAYVGEGAIVLEDVPAHAVVYGNPAQLTRSWTEEGGWQDASVPRTA